MSKVFKSARIKGITDMAMKIPDSCSRCGGKDLERGTLQSQTSVAFRPARLKFLVLSMGRVPVQADICMNCGHISLIADPEDVEHLLKEE